MQRNWHIICTKAKQEKKVIAGLTKKGIECFSPFAEMEMKNGVSTTMAWQPLFPSYVFALIATTQMPAIKRIPAVINLAHWQSTPVVISKEEIDAIRMVANNYINIQLEKTTVNMGANMAYVVNSVTTYNDNFASIKPQALKVVLPTLGYNIMAERAETSFEVIVSRRKLSLGSLFSRKPKLAYAVSM